MNIAGYRTDTMDKLYITHYYYPGTDPWKNIMLLPEEEAFRKAEELASAHPDTTSFGRFADFKNYYPERKKADAFVREKFIELGETPSSCIPIRLLFWSANISENGLTAAIRSLLIWMLFPTIRSASRLETAVL